MGRFPVECIARRGRKWSDVLALMHKAPTKTHMCSAAPCTALCQHCTLIQHRDTMQVCFSSQLILFRVVVPIVWCPEKRGLGKQKGCKLMEGT